MKPKAYAIFTLSFALLTGCATTPKPQPAAAAPTNDFPTLTRVEYVLNCMKEKGGKNYDNLYHCVCAVDHVAAKMSHDEFMQAETFETNKNLAGERGGVFRDPPQSKELRDKLKATLDSAEAACFPSGKASAPDAK